MTARKAYLVEYFYEGAWWGVEINAVDFDDARQRLSAMSTAQLRGKIITTVPANGLSWFFSIWKRVVPHG